MPSAFLRVGRAANLVSRTARPGMAKRLPASCGCDVCLHINIFLNIFLCACTISRHVCRSEILFADCRYHKLHGLFLLVQHGH